MIRVSLLLAVLACAACMLGARPGFAQSAASNKQNAAPAQVVQSIDGGAGPCSVTFTVIADAKPVVAANVKVHIEYGFGGVRRLDLEAYSGNDGKVQFTGLPSRVRRPPLQFRASKGDLAGSAVYNPESECKADHEIVLLPKK